MRRIFRLAAALLLAIAAPAIAQTATGYVQQSGTVTPGHAAMWTTSGVLQDAGSAANGNLSELGVTNPGLGICQNSAKVTNSGGYLQMCLGYVGGVPTISENAYGGATQQPLDFNLNGTTYQFPMALSGIVGPASTTIGDFALWNNGTGTLLKDVSPSSGIGNSITVTPAGGSIAAPLATVLGRTVNVLDYGARCDGSTDDTAQIQDAINAVSTSGGTIRFPHSTCIIAGTLTLSTNGILLQGQGPGATILDFTGTGTADAMQIGTMPAAANCTGATAPSDCQQAYNISVRDMTVNASARTGGYLFDINGAAQITLSDLRFTGWDIVFAQYVNNVIIDNLQGYARSTSGKAIYFYQPITTGTSNGWYRSDQLTMKNLLLGEQGSGTTCLYIDGYVNTVNAENDALLQCNYGMIVANSQNSTTYFPNYIMLRNFQIDGGSQSALYITGGRDFYCLQCDFNSDAAPAGVRIVDIEPDASFSVTSGIHIANSSFHTGPNESAFLDAQAITIDGSQFFQTYTAGGAATNVEIGAAANGVTITGSFLGKRIGDPVAPTYGVTVDPGAANVALTGNDYAGASAGSVDNASAAAIGFVGGIGFNGAPVTVTSCAGNTFCN